MKTALVLTASVLVTAGTLLARQAPKPPRGCTDATLNGRYGVHATGEVIGVGPFAAVAVFTFDGNGHLTGTVTAHVNENNVLERTPLTGTYQVTPDCFVSDSWTLPNGSTSQHESVIVDQGRGYFILNTTVGDPGVISGEARQLFSGGHRITGQPPVNIR